MHTTISQEGECCLGVGLRADHDCEQCNYSLCSAIGLSLLDQSEAVAFYRDHGIDIGITPYWQLEWCVSDDYTVVRSMDPWRLDVTITLGDDSLQVTLNGDLNLVTPNAPAHSLVGRSAPASRIDCLPCSLLLNSISVTPVTEMNFRLHLL
jgi:hypothetical protein